MALTRRLQVLLDEERYERLRRRSEQTRLSIGCLVRQALDVGLPPDGEDRRRAADALLAAEPMPVEDWEVMKEQMLDEVYGAKGRDYRP